MQFVDSSITRSTWRPFGRELKAERLSTGMIFLFIPSTSSGPEPVEGLTIPGPDLAYRLNRMIRTRSIL